MCSLFIDPWQSERDECERGTVALAYHINAWKWLKSHEQLSLYSKSQQIGLRTDFSIKVSLCSSEMWKCVNTVMITCAHTHTHAGRQAGRQGCPLKPAFSGPRTVLASVKPPQACHRNGTAINLTDIIQSDGWGGDKTGVCVCVCACVLCSATITCYGIQPRVPAMSAACCKTQRICFLFIFLFHWGSQSDTILLDWHVGGSDVRSGSFRWC